MMIFFYMTTVKLMLCKILLPLTHGTFPLTKQKWKMGFGEVEVFFWLKFSDSISYVMYMVRILTTCAIKLSVIFYIKNMNAIIILYYIQDPDISSLFKLTNRLDPCPIVTITCEPIVLYPILNFPKKIFDHI